jgi:hypothetical protein
MLKQIFLSLFFLVFTQIAQAKTGFYAGSFDLSSISSFETIKQAIEEKELDELIILVERLAGPLEKYTASPLKESKKSKKIYKIWNAKFRLLQNLGLGKNGFKQS